MRALPFEQLLGWALAELDRCDSVYGVHRRLFWTPQPAAPYVGRLFGRPLASPVGPAAGPHTQLAQNIVSAWLCGGRFIELKTVQIKDQLDIPRPCIDMEDEGYNVEWSQELRLEESTHQYVAAWALIHLLHHVLGFSGPVGTVFNMSVGYDLEGITSPPMQAFMARLEDATVQISRIREHLARHHPQLARVDIPTQVADNVTLSTMHGCPPQEIERIARYLLAERGLHVFVKLNPTLLGKDEVMDILHRRLGYTEIDIPDRVFTEDLQYEQAVEIIARLQREAAQRGLFFGVKLSNTLPTANHKGVLPGDEMYMSGRALFPITMRLFAKLARQFDGQLEISYAAGADALNAATVLGCGARTVTAASDLLKPGGYLRLRQWLEQLDEEMRAAGAASLEQFSQGGLERLAAAAAAAGEEPRYRKSYFPFGLPKVDSKLAAFDCVAAPCVAQCPVAQDVPEYAWLIARGDYDRALQVILHRNPLPGITGYVCTHQCETRCTRNNYEQPVAIRALKRFAAERGRARLPHTPPRTSDRVAVVGGGPAGLSAACLLALSGVPVTVFEGKDRLGGMAAIAPRFRLPQEVVAEDVARIVDLGVALELNRPVAGPPEGLLAEGFAAVYLAVGLQDEVTLPVAGMAGAGVYTALRLLEETASGRPPELGERVVVIGGGNTAMDAARTAQRLTGTPAVVVYRRTRAEMPAQVEELEALLEEGNQLVELASPQRVVRDGDRLVGLECVRNELGAPGPDGRRRPVRIPGSEFLLPADAVVLAVGQRSQLAFPDGSRVSLSPQGTLECDPETGATSADGVYGGGDACRGAATIVEACADGRRAAAAICRRLGVEFTPPPARFPELSPEELLQVKAVRGKRLSRVQPPQLPPQERQSFEVVEQTLPEAAARQEAARCLQCSALCDKCVEVCPNRANYAYCVTPVDLTLPRLTCRQGELVVSGREWFAVRQRRQIVHVEDLCNACGNCATFCVHRGEPFRDKPRLFLDETGFRTQRDNAFFIQGNTIRRRERGEEAVLTADDAGMTLITPQLTLTLGPDFEILDRRLTIGFEGDFSLREAAEMAVILAGVKRSLPFLVGGDEA
ncbi:MAG: putative selenate reductase subunit YgfK [Candidatus Bipolaricaulaceae bacterium]